MHALPRTRLPLPFALVCRRTSTLTTRCCSNRSSLLVWPPTSCSSRLASTSPRCPRTRSLTHSLAHSLKHSLAHSLTRSLTQALTHSSTHSLTHSSTHALTHALALAVKP
eukprot:6176247-Pleurochrysis_carterae.AAC.1